MSLLLAIDTSTDQVGVALTDGETTSELTWPARLRQTATILVGVTQLLGLAGRSIGEVEAVAVAIGPGSFSGLRVGMSVAKGLVLARGAAIVGVSTLLATAAPYVVAGATIVPVVSAGRGRSAWTAVFAAEPEPTMGTMHSGGPAELTAFVRGLNVPAVICGDIGEGIRGSLTASPDALLPRGSERRPGAVARLGWEQWRRGEADDPVALEPTYLHPAPPT